MDPRGLKVDQNAYFLLVTHTKQLLLVTFCDTTAGIRKDGSVTHRRTDRRMERQTVMKSEIFI